MQQELIDYKKAQNVQLHLVVACQKAPEETNQRINHGQSQTDAQNLSQMLWKQVVVACNVPIVVVGNAHVEQDVQRGRQAQQSIVKSKVIACYNLHMPVDAQQPKRLDQHVD